MISVERVNQLGQRIFNTSLNEKKVSRDSNPFSKSNFQKNILTEDVFESSTKKVQNTSFNGLNDRVAQNTKRIYSIFAGSLNDFSKRFYGGIESIKEFCHGIKNYAVSVWNKLYEIGNQDIKDSCKQGYDTIKDILSYDMGSLINTRERQMAKMAKLDPQTQVKPMLKASIEALEKELHQAA